MQNNKNVHAGHRERMRNLILGAGLENLNDHQILEYILYHVVSRRDTNELAHDLLNSYDSIYDVMLNSTPNELEKFNLLGSKSAGKLHRFKHVFNLYEISKQKFKLVLNTVDKQIRYIRRFLSSDGPKEFYALALDEDSKVISRRKLAMTFDNEFITSDRPLIRFAVTSGAKYIVLAHNHINNESCYPSKEDDEVTNLFKIWLNESGVILFDHVIVGCDGTFSFRLKKILDY